MSASFFDNAFGQIWRDSIDFSHREVAHTHWILEEPLEAGGPAGHALLWNPSMAACSWKTAITVQAALAAASLQLDSTVVWRAGEQNAKVRGH